MSQAAHPQVQLQELPQTAVGETVQVEGTVLQQAPLLAGWLYQLADDTGHIWVRSLEPAPAVGATVQLQGVVEYEAIVLGEMDISEYYLQETARTLREAAPATVATAPHTESTGE
jgi:RecJ-like exonuclease